MIQNITIIIVDKGKVTIYVQYQIILTKYYGVKSHQNDLPHIWYSTDWNSIYRSKGVIIEYDLPSIHQ